MPTLPWWFLAVTLTVLGAWATVRWVRLCLARQRQIERPAKALRQAKDALAVMIADPVVFGPAREQAVSAYESVTDALKKENRN